MNKHGFTLAELLIALAILGVIATFTIPKVLQGQTNSKNTAIIKETFAMVSGAYDAYRLSNTPSASTGFPDLTPYMNYVAVDTVSDYDTPGGTVTCGTAAQICLKLHNGAFFVYTSSMTFAGTNTTNALVFSIDPDGTQNASSQSDAGAGIWGGIYYNGRLTTHEYFVPNTVSSDLTRGPCPGCDPTWFTWEG